MNEELIEMAHPYALDAVDDTERHEVEALVARTDEATRTEFENEVRLVRETLAALSGIAASPPPHRLRARLLAQVAQSPRDARSTDDPPTAPISLDERRSRSRRWQIAVATAAAVALLAGGVVIGRQLGDTPAPATADQILDASDVQISSRDLPTGGTAMAMYSRAQDAAILVMKDVTPPSSDTVYQMWLIGESGSPVSAGMMTSDDVSPTTTVLLDDIGTMSALALTVEPPGGSAQPTSDPFATITFS